MGLRLPSQLSPVRTIKLTNISVQFETAQRSPWNTVECYLCFKASIHCVGLGRVARNDKLTVP